MVQKACQSVTTLAPTENGFVDVPLLCNRHRVQAATFEGVATDIDTQERAPHSSHYRYHLCTYRRPHRLG